MMKDTSAALQHYGIKNGSKIMMLGDAAPIPQPAPTSTPLAASSSNASANASAQSLHTMTPEELALHKLAEIETTLTQTTTPLVESYISLALEYTTTPISAIDPVQSKKLKDSHARVSELILQVLLKVDGVKVPEGDELVRGKRKEAVKRCNGYLDTVDGWKEKVREFEERVKQQQQQTGEGEEGGSGAKM
ncbi:hypothetical protein BCR33DRAFT_693735 [Rhizoclosmatium globosum]|uniref:BAG domain-containing protein n=1 Tax=Rhizoclosmatium globosum TaxID=329046 RepID=A0A1Y2CZZ4_9FUNG|nr:hypothetical protein BCR33DRAFT_693735 [Rhizoclosmatium globosum]|eukprot:ORY52580.1 hypothetical protein BCR33DRAFT_693735 [Rhizoclosmatium globosum]